MWREDSDHLSKWCGEKWGPVITGTRTKIGDVFSLSRPSRATDLVQLNIAYRKFLPEGVCFTSSGLAKQSRPGKALQEFFFPAFPHDLNLCPVDIENIWVENLYIEIKWYIIDWYSKTT